MSDKYIIKNCPSAIHNVVEEREIFYCASAKNEDLECQDCTDCVLKQIVELCKEVENIENVKTLYDAAQSGIFLQANKILKLLDIQEVE